MSANFWCWLPILALSPTAPDFLSRVEALHNPPIERPAPQIANFVEQLAKAYPEPSEKVVDTAWSDGPLIGDANGQFIDFGIRWDYYKKVLPLVISLGSASGLDCYDPQTSRYYPLEVE
ncbi:MAG TPA: hypothetical protein VIJ85_08245 [Rhizomicrobium sp.]